MLAAEDDKVKYLRKRLEHLREWNSDIENRLCDDAAEFIKTCDNENACNEYLIHIDTVMRNTFRYTMLIAVCTFLEESVKFLCERSVDDYRNKLKTCRRGTWLAKHRQLLADNTPVDLTTIKVELDTMEEFVEVRNCIVHKWGEVDGNVDRLIEIDEKKGADCCFGKWKDGFLAVTDQAVPTAVIASGDIVNKLLQDLHDLPGHCVY